MGIAADGGGPPGDTGIAPDGGATGDPQREGDPVRGRALLLNNGTPEHPYVSCGTPERLVTLGGLLDPGADAIKIPDRDAQNADLPYYMSRATTPSGVSLITVNCLLCHASPLGQGLVIGLGNPNRDFTTSGTEYGFSEAALEAAGVFLAAPEQAELNRVLGRMRAVGAFDTTDTVGINPADTMFGALAAHRDPTTLAWSDATAPILAGGTDIRVFTDVPTWWGTHRRDRMFFSGSGRGDHARLMMSTALLCADSTDEAEAIDSYFPDVAAYIHSLRPPSYEAVSGKTIDAVRAASGQVVYDANCKVCHGGRGDEGPDPTPFVPLSLVGTDDYYADVVSAGMIRPGGVVDYLFDFFNESWFGTYGAAGRLERTPEPGYSPPLLDGIWASAPYFHNGSVPTLDAVLDPTLRPAVFRRSTDPKTYDFDRLGWPYDVVDAKGTDATVYDATRPGYTNGGHTFAASLSDEERRDLLEYLKTF
jgi:mono/diheme cytochrome c family protein